MVSLCADCHLSWLFALYLTLGKENRREPERCQQSGIQVAEMLEEAFVIQTDVMDLLQSNAFLIKLDIITGNPGAKLNSLTSPSRYLRLPQQSAKQKLEHRRDRTARFKRRLYSNTNFRATLDALI
jgi:hypothetical protein